MTHISRNHGLCGDLIVWDAQQLAGWPHIMSALGADIFVCCRYRLRCQVTRADIKQFRGYLENAATAGRPLLVEDIDEPFDATILRLAKLVWMQRGEWQVKVGDRQVKAADGFRLYLTTKLTRPRLKLDTPASYINVINFTLSDNAITEQLLTCIFQHNKPVSENRFSYR